MRNSFHRQYFPSCSSLILSRYHTLGLMYRLRRTLSLLTTVLLLAPSLVRAQTTDVLVVTPIAAPDGNGEITTVIEDPADDSPQAGYGTVLNDAGQVAFWGLLTGTAGSGYEDNSGLFLYDEGEVVQLIRAGQSVPDGDGVFYYVAHVNTPALNNEGRIAVHQFITENASGDYFNWGGMAVDASGPEATLYLREGYPGPGEEEIIQYLGNPSLTDTGLIGFDGLFVESDPGGQPAIFRGDLTTGTVEVLVRESDTPPEGDGFFRLLHGADINEAGQVVFSADINGSDELDDGGLYRAEANGTTITKIARVGDPAPDSDEVVYRIFSGSRNPINEAGQVAYSLLFAPSTYDPPTSAGVYRYDDGEQVEIARTGEPAPGGGTFVSFGIPHTLAVVPALNDAGDVSFVAKVHRDGLIYTGMYRGDGEELVRVVDNGMDTPSGNGYFLITSASASGWKSNDTPKMNEAGQVAFFTNLANGEGDLYSNEGIFFYDDELGVMKVARKGDDLLGSTITQLRFTPRGQNAHDNARSGLNNLGQVAYAFELADGRSGVALWTCPPEASPVATEPPAGVPDVLAVEAAYPNPFRGAATLRFALPASDAVALTVYDVLGRRVLRRDLGRLGSGVHRVDLRGDALAPGVYVARLTTASAAATVRLVKAE